MIFQHLQALRFVSHPSDVLKEQSSYVSGLSSSWSYIPLMDLCLMCARAHARVRVRCRWDCKGLASATSWSREWWRLYKRICLKSPSLAPSPPFQALGHGLESSYIAAQMCYTDYVQRRSWTVRPFMDQTWSVPFLIVFPSIHSHGNHGGYHNFFATELANINGSQWEKQGSCGAQQSSKFQKVSKSVCIAQIQDAFWVQLCFCWKMERLAALSCFEIGWRIHNGNIFTENRRRFQMQAHT